MQRKLLIVSHRGVPPLAPEHSFAGYDLAIMQGTFHIEQDLQLSKDGELFVSHDPILERTTNSFGAIAELTTSEIKQAEFVNGEHIHTLDEVFARYGKTINYVIETKFAYATDDDFRGEDRLLALIQQYDLATHVIFQSFHRASLRYLHTKLPQVPTLLLVKRIANYGIEHADMSTLQDIDIFCLESQLLTTRATKLFQAAGKEVFVYFEKGHDTPENLAHVLEIGIDGVFTDYTADVITLVGVGNYR